MIYSGRVKIKDSELNQPGVGCMKEKDFSKREWEGGNMTRNNKPVESRAPNS